MVLGLDCHLHVVADDAGAAPARRHRAAVGIGERDLLIGRGQHLLLDRREALHLAFELRELLLELLRLGRERLRRLLQVGRVELAEIARDALLQLRPPPLHLRAREVPVAVVDRLELAAVDGDACRREQPHLRGTARRTARTPCGSPAHCPCGNRRSSCGRARAGRAATSPRDCGPPRARAAGSTARG